MRGFAQRISDSDEAIIFELLMIGRLKNIPPSGSDCKTAPVY